MCHLNGHMCENGSSSFALIHISMLWQKHKTEGEEGNSKAVPPKVSRKVTQNVPLRNGASGNEPNLSEGFVAEVCMYFHKKDAFERIL